MSRLMFDRQWSEPPGYRERGCGLVSYRLPLLRHCFVLCSEAGEELSDAAKVDLMAFFLIEAQRLARTAVGDPEAFMLIHSGRSARKRSTWHLHVFVVRNRWQKAWVYTILGIKNLALASYRALRSRFTRRRADDRPGWAGRNR